MFDHETDGPVMAEVPITVAPGRLLVAVGLLGALGLIFLLLGATAIGEGRFGPAALIPAGAVVLWAARELWRSGSAGLVFGPEGLRLGDGTVLAARDEMLSIDRGVFAFKPTGGFLLTLTPARRPNLWRPGLCWRVGRRLGVGGILRAHEAKLVAELLAADIAARRAR
ncbi:hypothetical protein [Poseidonocella sedimentorum]|uniref:Uncharacterized protein n=1 Tax=Poseidonocella sedimentorum TaxID=871652 RepID=A0A1I6E586_9RHOB|nr:hypothetical protein [Poseidonocella sedimentorum]SFR12910.1 hypothetical protein SAMN04515673_107138 [Poseidonocella sedimentorum]